ncbi:hypothetical protein FN846DRAFT_965870 [Sphaerosporella brunnea]|uniref:Uncharacterized protein n=1 Tax=Sphaerosporella brunnea TaxID=1250544 RepID=A0A5J5ELA7_9PEZI|nr:hypothetical protein FN846DRAFT_965870 [Sphaerosporella brunnea]
MLYTPMDYTWDIFNRLPLFEDAQQALSKDLIQTSEVSMLRDLFRRHNLHTRLGLIMLHRHFSVYSGEKVVEYNGVATPWDVGDATEVFGGRLVPRCWAFFDGKLCPTEFKFEPPRRGAAPNVTEFPSEFVDEFFNFISKRGLDGLLGLTVFDSVGGFSGPREAERTVGRVSITLPVDMWTREFEEGVEGTEPTETAWTFGCHESMDDSGLMNARICWVCHECCPPSR